MSHAQAASSGISSQQNSQHGAQQKYQQNSKGRFYNEKMIVCMSNGISYEQLADALYDKGFWKFVTGLQRVDFNPRFIVVIEDVDIRDKLVESGLSINGKHIFFGHHKRRIHVDPTRRVHVSQILIGVTDSELEEVFSFFGTLLKVNPVTKVMHGRRIDTGDRVIIFSTDSHMDSHRLAEFVPTGHFAKDYPKNKTKPEDQSNKPAETPAEDQKTKSPESQTSQEEIMDTQSTDASVQNEIRITEPDSEVLSTPMNDVISSVSTDPEVDAESISLIEDYQDVTSEAEASKAWTDAKVEAEIQAGIKPCCSRCGTGLSD